MAKTQTTYDVVASAAVDAPTLPGQPVTVNAGDIARRAYDLYLARGCEPGHDVDDWMQAERELREPLGAGIS